MITDPHDVILRPVITEKSMQQLADNKYTFLVHPKANKTQIKRAVEQIFKVRVAKVNTVRVRGKLRRVGRFAGYQPDAKKAIVTLAEGHRIKEFFEDVS
ncbi:50S ribosomal protein L23 [Thermaerobacter sp. PB12/4term]|uniref:Large ribosomal subunit protein uL23 n=1 Tax=Thermaerobacter subterraneus DSM 13965 TaxID=867903 RepID=K6P175_9FIRM|nr:ribosomal protein L23 [Thermaerobacter subterraneus DSM 13965]QIA28049.1 50S ribosomal protein L23 [Thermaerobacter sp. PB12/4term]